VLAAALSACAAEPGAETAPPAGAVTVPTVGSDAGQPQLTVDAAGELLLTWTARGASGVDLYIARARDGEFASPVRINTVPGSINPITIDEMRPAVAVGSDDRLAVAWTDRDYDIQVAVSSDGGASFDAPIRLNQDQGEALQEFPAIAFDGEGVLHAAWLDPRIAPEGAEEPADLYYARVDGGAVAEQNLTGDQESSVCGCCLPDLQIDGEDIVITFRNTTDDGYRDPFQVRGTVAGEFGAPVAVTAPVWQIDACPIAGPIGIGDTALWIDGSTGVRRLLESRGAGNPPAVVLEDSDEWFLDYPPRRIAGAPAGGMLLLVPAVPAYVIRRDGSEWSVVAGDLPGWATSAALVGDEIVMVGTTGDRFVMERRPFPAN
jgi:hypothetical protein